MISWLGSQKKLTLVFSSLVLGISSRFIYTGFKARCGCVASIYLYKCSTITNICTKRNLQCKPWLGRLMNHCIKPTPNWGSDYYYYYFETKFFCRSCCCYLAFKSALKYQKKIKLSWLDKLKKCTKIEWKEHDHDLTMQIFWVCLVSSKKNYARIIYKQSSLMNFFFTQ